MLISKVIRLLLPWGWGNRGHKWSSVDDGGKQTQVFRLVRQVLLPAGPLFCFVLLCVFCLLCFCILEIGSYSAAKADPQTHYTSQASLRLTGIVLPPVVYAGITDMRRRAQFLHPFNCWPGASKTSYANLRSQAAAGSLKMPAA